jgi:hypothetical protein
MSLLAILKIDDLCQLVEEYAAEFKGLLSQELPELVDRKQTFTTSSIAAVNGKLAYLSSGFQVVDLQTGNKSAEPRFAIDKMAAVSEKELVMSCMGHIHFWDMDADECLWSKAMPFCVRDLKLLSNDKLAISNSSAFVILDLRSREQVMHIQVMPIRMRLLNINDVDELGQNIAAAVDNFLDLYDVKTQKLIAIRQVCFPITQLLALPGNRLAASSEDQKITVFDTFLTCVYTIEHVSSACMQLLSDGSLAATSIDGHHILVYKADELVHDIAYYGWPLSTLKALPDNRLVSFHVNGDVCVWR